MRAPSDTSARRVHRDPGTGPAVGRNRSRMAAVAGALVRWPIASLARTCLPVLRIPNRDTRAFPEHKVGALGKAFTGR